MHHHERAQCITPLPQIYYNYNTFISNVLRHSRLLKMKKLHSTPPIALKIVKCLFLNTWYYKFASHIVRRDSVWVERAGAVTYWKRLSTLFLTVRNLENFNLGQEWSNGRWLMWICIFTIWQRVSVTVEYYTYLREVSAKLLVFPRWAIPGPLTAEASNRYGSHAFFA